MNDRMKKIAEDYQKQVADKMRTREAKDGKTDATYDQAIKAQEKFQSLSQKFHLVAGHGIGRDDRGSFLEVFLTVDPSPAEKAAMPKNIDGVRVNYTTTGRTCGNGGC